MRIQAFQDRCLPSDSRTKADEVGFAFDVELLSPGVLLLDCAYVKSSALEPCQKGARFRVIHDGLRMLREK